MTRPTLSDLASTHRTDKGPRTHNYTAIYEGYFGPLRDQKIRLAELGYGVGDSARMWHDYFPNGNFWYVDNSVNCPMTPPRSILSMCDQADPKGVQRAIKHGLFNVIIDDASHMNDKTIASFKLWWNALKPGGLYVIEDLHTSYWTHYHGDPDPDANHTAMAFLKGLADEVNRRFFPAEHRRGFDVEWIHFYDSIVFIKRSFYITSLSSRGTTLPVTQDSASLKE